MCNSCMLYHILIQDCNEIQMKSKLNWCSFKFVLYFVLLLFECLNLQFVFFKYKAYIV